MGWYLRYISQQWQWLLRIIVIKLWNYTGHVFLQTRYRCQYQVMLYILYKCTRLFVFRLFPSLSLPRLSISIPSCSRSASSPTSYRETSTQPTWWLHPSRSDDWSEADFSPIQISNPILDPRFLHGLQYINRSLSSAYYEQQRSVQLCHAALNGAIVTATKDTTGPGVALSPPQNEHYHG